MPAVVEALDCNCSVCTPADLLRRIVPCSRFRLLRGEETLADYPFATGAAVDLFCRRCGAKSFCIPRSHPDGVDINLHCLDGSTNEEVPGLFDDNDRARASVAGLKPVWPN